LNAPAVGGCPHVAGPDVSRSYDIRAVVDSHRVEVFHSFELGGEA